MENHAPNLLLARRGNPSAGAIAPSDLPPNSFSGGTGKAIKYGIADPQSFLLRLALLSWQPPRRDGKEEKLLSQMLQAGHKDS